MCYVAQFNSSYTLGMLDPTWVDLQDTKNCSLQLANEKWDGDHVHASVYV